MKRKASAIQDKFILLLISLFSLFGGLIIYILFRSTRPKIFNFLNLGALYNTAFVTLPVKSSLRSMLVYNFPDGLWLLSGLELIRVIWYSNITLSKIYTFVFFLLGIFLEIAQLLEIVPGTFDVFDIFTFVLIALVEGIIYNWFVKGRFRDEN